MLYGYSYNYSLCFRKVVTIGNHVMLNLFMFCDNVRGLFIVVWLEFMHSTILLLLYWYVLYNVNK